MKLNRVNHSVFQRIGDTFARYIDHDHFMGMNAFDSPLKKRSKKNSDKKDNK